MGHRIRAFSAGLIALLLVGGMAQAQLADEDVRRPYVGIMDAGNTAIEIAVLRHVPRVNVINLKYIPTPRVRRSRLHRAEFAISAQKHAPDIQRLRAALRANPVTRAALAAKGVAVNRIVAVHIFSNGSLMVYIL